MVLSLSIHYEADFYVVKRPKFPTKVTGEFWTKITQSAALKHIESTPMAHYPRIAIIEKGDSLIDSSLNASGARPLPMRVRLVSKGY
ncbi:hypothetical protein FKM82_000329 [Ascaphus truei]